MKIAVTSEGNTPESAIDTRFGRCAFFAIYNSETKEIEFLSNPAKESSEGAGPAAVQFIAKKGVTKVYAGEFGMKIRSLLDSLKIEMINEQDKTISEIISQL
jgi:predicted Fe-Mo cluster-binding NifX family protein